MKANIAPALTDADIAMFAALKIPSDLLEQAGVRRVTDAEARTDYGVHFKGDLSGICFPYHTPTGERVNARVRRDHPEIERGKPRAKYVSAARDHRRFYYLPSCRELIGSVSSPVVIVESEKAALALWALSQRAGRTFLPVGLGGCWSFRGRIGKALVPDGSRVDEFGPLMDFDVITLLRRRAIICLDSNVQTNPAVQAAETALRRELQRRGADVVLARVPIEDGVNGIDDYIALHDDAETLAILDGASAPSTARAHLVRLSEVEPEAVRWFWPSRIAAGKLALIIGDPGASKSTMLLDIASRITRGGAWPDGGVAPKGNVIILSAEDGLADTIRPRIDRQGGDASRVYALQAIRQGDNERMFSLSVDLLQLEEAIENLGHVVLIIVDPLSAYLGDKDTYKDSEIRTVLGPLSTLSEKHRVSVAGIMHLTKDQQRKALYRGMGSIAFVAAARSVFAVAVDKDNPERRLVAGIKNNLARIPPTLAYSIDDTGKLTWEDAPVSGVDAESALSSGPPEEAAERRDAEDFLRESLANGAMAAKEIKNAARENGIADRTLSRAKSRLGVTVERSGFGEGSRWYWLLPPKVVTSTPKVATHGDVATFAQPIDTNTVTSMTLPKIATSEGVATFEGDGGNLRTARGEERL